MITIILQFVTQRFQNYQHPYNSFKGEGRGSPLNISKVSWFWDSGLPKKVHSVGQPFGQILTFEAQDHQGHVWWPPNCTAKSGPKIKNKHHNLDIALLIDRSIVSWASKKIPTQLTQKWLSYGQKNVWPNVDMCAIFWRDLAKYEYFWIKLTPFDLYPWITCFLHL